MAKSEIPQYRRKYPRRTFYKSVGVLFAGSYRACETTEIGEGGLAFQYPAELAVGSPIVVSFQLPGGSFFSVQSLVRNSDVKIFDKKNRVFTIGCSFENVNVHFKRELRNFVAQR